MPNLAEGPARAKQSGRQNNIYIKMRLGVTGHEETSTTELNQNMIQWKYSVIMVGNIWVPWQEEISWPAEYYYYYYWWGGTESLGICSSP
jgi:hypothetical protein